jgi:hypothetical protein
MIDSKCLSGAQHRFLSAQRHIQDLARISGANATLSLIEEVQVTRDERREDYDQHGNLIGWTCTPASPHGVGWSNKDSTSDTKTTWHRWIVVPGKMQ